MTSELDIKIAGLANARQRFAAAIAMHDSADQQAIERKIAEKLLDPLSGPMRRRPNEVREEAKRLASLLNSFRKQTTDICMDVGLLQASAQVAASGLGLAKLGALMDHTIASTDAIASKLLHTAPSDDPMAERDELDRVSRDLDQKGTEILHQAELSVIGAAVIIEHHCAYLGQFVGKRLNRSVSDILLDLHDLAGKLTKESAIAIVLEFLDLSILGKPLALGVKVWNALRRPLSNKPSATDELIVLQKIVHAEEKALAAFKSSIMEGHAEITRIADTKFYTPRVMSPS